MPSAERVDWYLLTLIVGTALAAFVLGSATTIWLGLPTLGGALTPSTAGLPHRSEAIGPESSSANASQAPTPQTPAPAKTVAAAAESASQPATSPAPVQGTASEATSPGAPAAGSATPAAPPVGDFSLQFGAFLDAANAKSLIGQLGARGYSPVSIDVADGYGHIWHYIRLGAFPDEQAAGRAASEVLERTGIGAAIVRVSAANAGQ
jgi:cell division septation protein DedD